MRIEDAQEMMRKIYLERDRARGTKGTLKRTFDELKELRDVINNKQPLAAIADEVADVFAWLCSLANLLGINISQALYAKYTDACSKCKQSPCLCPTESKD